MSVLESEALDDEAYDDEAIDDEAYDDESEFLGQLLGGPAAAIGNVLGGLFGGRPSPPRPPLPQIAVPTPGGGVSTATLNTPQGSATLRLPEPVVTKQEFEAGIKRLEEGINRDRARVNTVAGDLDTLRTRVTAVVADTQRDITKLRTTVRRSTRAHRAAIARIRRDQSQQQMIGLVMTMMMQRSAREALEDHTHTGSTAAAVVPDSGDNTMMFLPLMMMGGGGGDSMSMMMPMMIMAMGR
jgi:hypothetical protein